MKIDAGQMPQLEPVGGLSLKSGAPSADKEAVAAKKVAREFEALFVGMMLKSMRNTVGKEMPAGKGNGEETYRSLLDQEYAKTVAEHGGVGLARMIEQQLLKKVEPASSAGSIDTGGERR